MFNPIDPIQFRTILHDFETHRYLTIPNFLSSSGMQSAQKAIMEAAWSRYMHPSSDVGEEAAWHAIDARIVERELSYKFYRTLDHSKACGCASCVFVRLFKEDMPTLLYTLGLVVDRKLDDVYAFFSKYTSGCFLSPHSDKGNGDLAFVLNLTADPWHPIWGGCLHLLESDWKTLKKLVTPTFNELIVFEVPEERTPHYVSPVAAGVPHARYAFSGWFK
jgi:2-oxoglutarate-Fe(II)-dependent oxygenase superfamily protein